MKALGLALGAFSIATAVVAARTGQESGFILAAFSTLAAWTAVRAASISIYLRIFVALFATETMLLGADALAAASGVWPARLAFVAIPVSVPTAAAVFCVFVYVLSFLPVVRRITTIADRYFQATARLGAGWPALVRSMLDERSLAIAMVVLLVTINQAELALSVLGTFVARDLFNAIQAFDADAFWHQLLVAAPLFGLAQAALRITEIFLRASLIVRWRRWLSEDYAARWLGGNNHYRMSLAKDGSDNPDQRIAEDVGRFIENGLYTFSILLIKDVATFISYAILLWTLSSGLALPGTHIVIPGLLLWCALIYAVAASMVTHLVGRPLSHLSFTRQRYEADYRYALARLREHSEQVALLDGEAAEMSTLRRRFDRIVQNVYSVAFVQVRLGLSTAIINRYAAAIPYALTAPFFFSRQITLGLMQQVSNAYNIVNGTLSFFILHYSSLAEFMAVLNRLASFDCDLDAGAAMASQARSCAVDGRLALQGLSLQLPSGASLISSVDLKIAPGESVTLTGPSGSGKSTLFRAIAGIWPYVDGLVQIPQGAKVMVLPQNPYLPVGTLREALCYPGADAREHSVLADALEDVGLAKFVGDIDLELNSGQILSIGEQQRVAIARALLAEPDWLFLDEATSAVDAELERDLFDILARRLPKTAIIANAHHGAALKRPGRRISIRSTTQGRAMIEDGVVK